MRTQHSSGHSNKKQQQQQGTEPWWVQFCVVGGSALKAGDLSLTELQAADRAF